MIIYDLVSVKNTLARFKILTCTNGFNNSNS
jgi:hypothetical protein